MSLWEQILNHKVLNFWLKLLLISVIVHLAVLLSLFVKKKEVLNFNISTSHLLVSFPVKVNNLKKSVRQSLPTSSLSKQKSAPTKANQPKAKDNTLDKSKAAVVEKKVVKPEQKEVKQQSLPEIKKAEEKPNVAKPKEDAPIANQDLEIGRKDLEELKLYEKVHNAISQNFAPPKGVPAGLECVVKLVVDKNGKLKSLDFEKSSNILMFDLSAKKAVVNAIIPKELWGKDIILNFKSD